MTNIRNFDPTTLSIGKITFKSIAAVTYHIKYVTMKTLDCSNINIANSLSRFL